MNTAAEVNQTAGGLAGSPGRLYKQMRTVRTTEETLLRLFSEGRLNGTVHTCLGQEACAVGVVSALDPARDVVCSNHRGHGHYLAYTDDVEGLLSEVMGLPSGVCGGIGGSQHLYQPNFYSNGILGGMVPVATGIALAEKRRGNGGVVAVFLGDGVFGEGILYEAFNIASLWSLPVLFVVEANGYAQSTPTEREHAGTLSARATAFGIRVAELDGNNVLTVREAAVAALQRMRSAPSPEMLFLHTYRLGPHSKGDDTRDPAEIAAHRVNDPLIRLRRALAEADATAIDHAVQARLLEIEQRAIQFGDTLLGGGGVNP